MFEYFRTGKRAFLCYMPHDKKGDAVRFGDTHELARAFANLPHAARGRGERFGINRLNGIDYHIFGV